MTSVRTTFTLVVTADSITMWIGVPAGCISLQVKINFRSPYYVDGASACYVYPDGDVAINVDWASCGRSPYVYYDDGSNNVYSVIPGGEVGGSFNDVYWNSYGR